MRSEQGTASVLVCAAGEAAAAAAAALYLKQLVAEVLCVYAPRAVGASVFNAAATRLLASIATACEVLRAFAVLMSDRWGGGWACGADAPRRLQHACVSQAGPDGVSPAQVGVPTCVPERGAGLAAGPQEAFNELLLTTAVDLHPQAWGMVGGRGRCL